MEKEAHRYYDTTPANVSCHVLERGVRKVKSNLNLLAVVLVAGCASAGSAPAGDSARQSEKVRVDAIESIDLSHEVDVAKANFTAAQPLVWNAAIEAFKSLSFPLTEADEKAGRLTHWNTDLKHTIAGRRTSAYFDCGAGPTGARADTYRLSVKVIQAFESLGGNGTAMRTQVQAAARSGGMSGDPLHCNSTGELEKLISSMIATRLQ